MKHIFCALGFHKFELLGYKKKNFLEYYKFFRCVRCGYTRVTFHKIDI